MVNEQRQLCTFSAWSGGIVDGLYDRITTTNRITAQKYCRQSYAPYRNLFAEVSKASPGEGGKLAHVSDSHTIHCSLSLEVIEFVSVLD